MAELVLTPEKGRVGQSRQVPAQSVPVVDMDHDSVARGDLNLIAETAFHRYTKHGAYAFVVRDEAGVPLKIFLYCNRTDKKIATIFVTTKES